MQCDLLALEDIKMFYFVVWYITAFPLSILWLFDYSYRLADG